MANSETSSFTPGKNRDDEIAATMQNQGAMLDPEFLRPCLNPACERVVPASYLGARQVEHCCAACAQAHEDGYEVHEDGSLAHSTGCDERWEQRRDREVRFAR
jgi:hypothetical protein